MIPRTLLLILDGYGLAPASDGNAAKLATTPTLNRLFKRPEMAKLDASGESVGLPSGFIGNSEVGHLNIGGGRVVLQNMKGIDSIIENGDFFTNPALLELCSKIKSKGGRLHLMGLLSDGGVHSHINHIVALLRLAHEQDVPVYLHAFMDGRDTSPTSGVTYIKQILPSLEKYNGKLASICGRYYAMDRDQRWERVKTAWELLVHGKDEASAVDASKDPIEVIESYYAKDISDEFILPHLMLDAHEVCVKDDDGLFFFNFRADRGRQLAHAFFDEEFSFFERGITPQLSGMASMTQYESTLPIGLVLKKEILENTLGEVVAKNGYSQLRIAETEKYAHVTYFFNGGKENPCANEDRILVPSPKDVATYDLKPEMSADEVTKKLIEAFESGKYDFIVCNLANPDMVGHTGSIPAAIEACRVVDACVERIEKAVLQANGILCVTADHGNVEKMIDTNGEIHTAHSMNQVPFIIENKEGFIPLYSNGKLGDIAPTILSMWKEEIPKEMTGNSLLS